jgi:hypothetical protein
MTFRDLCYTETRRIVYCDSRSHVKTVPVMCHKCDTDTQAIERHLVYEAMGPDMRAAYCMIKRGRVLPYNLYRGVIELWLVCRVSCGRVSPDSYQHLLLAALLCMQDKTARERLRVECDEAFALAMQ